MAGIARTLVSSARTAVFATVTGRQSQLAPPVRSISRTWILQCEQKVAPKQMLTPTEFDKTSLVMAKIYPTKEDIPASVSHNKIRKARDYMRIRISIMMMLFASGAALAMIRWGRHDRDRGGSLSKMGMDQQTKLREQGMSEEAQAVSDTAQAKATS